MEYLPGGLTLTPGSRAFPLSTDSMVLAHFIKLKRNAKVLDLGSGCGTLGLLLCATDQTCTVTGVELDANAHEAALANIARNHLGNRLDSICIDLRQLDPAYNGFFDCCVSNPPYFSGGPASISHAQARREDCCSIRELFTAAGKGLKYGGDFYLVHRPERLAELIAAGAERKLEAKRLRLVRHRQTGDISLILLQFRKGGKPGLQIDEIHLFDDNEQPSRFYREIYHIQED